LTAVPLLSQGMLKQTEFLNRFRPGMTGLSRLKLWSHKDLFEVALIPSGSEAFGSYPATIAGFLF
jgi:hypothetical protein